MFLDQSLQESGRTEDTIANKFLLLSIEKAKPPPKSFQIENIIIGSLNTVCKKLQSANNYLLTNL